MVSTFEKILLTSVKTGLYLILLTPLVVTPWTIFPFVFGKALYFQVIIEIIFALWLVLAILNKSWRPAKSLLLCLLSSYFLVLFVSAFFGADFHRSFWGTEERMSGIFTLLHFFALFLVLTSVNKSLKDWQLFFAVSAVVSVIVVILAFFLRVQEMPRFGIDWHDRISGTIANPIFFASYVLGHLFLCLVLFFYQKGRLKFLWLAAGVINFFGLVLSQTRGAWLALIFGALTLLFLYFILRGGKTRRLSLAVLAFAILFAAALYFAKDITLIRLTPFLGRLAEVFAVDSSAPRIINWKIAIQGFLERPLFGWGPENFHIVFNKYYDPQLLRYSFYETWSDKPHNKILEILATSGICGAIIYLSLFFAVFWIIFRAWQKKQLPLGSSLIIAGLFLTYFIQNLFAFDTPSSYLLFFSVLGFVNFLKTSEEISDVDRSQTPDIDRYRSISGVDYRRRLALPLFFVLVAVSLYPVIRFNIQPALASNAMFKAVVIMGADIEKGNYVYKKALKNFNIYPEEWRLKYAETVINALIEQKISKEKLKPIVDFAANELGKNIAEHPRNSYYWFLLGQLLSEAGYFQEAEENLVKALELSPKRQQVFFGLGRVKMLEKKFDEAAVIFEQTVEFEPAVGYSHWYLGGALQTKDPERAQEEFIKAVCLGYELTSAQSIPLIANQEVISRFIKEKRYDCLENVYSNLVRLEPFKAELRAQYAEILRIYSLLLNEEETGRLKRAKREALKAAELDPRYKAEAEAFIKEIDKLLTE